MYQFYDPSIYPIVTTDLEGRILHVRTSGLHHYGYPDVMLENDFDGYEEVFAFIIGSVFQLTFDFEKEWYFDGKMFGFEMKNGIAYIRYIHELKEPRIMTISHPETGMPMIHKTRGLAELYGHPEFQIDAAISESKDLIDFVVLEVKSGQVYDEDITLTHGDKEFDIHRIQDRFGKDVFEIRESPINNDPPKKLVRLK